MTIAVYDMTVPIFTRMLTNLQAIMDKADTNASERKFDPKVLCDMRLAPDMIPFRGQVMIATDHVKGCVCRLAGREVPSWPDTEQTLPELKARIQKALDLLGTITPEELEGSEARQVILKLRGEEVVLAGQDYLTRMALPNFFFHVTTAYAILRHAGVPLGKRDYIG